MSNKTITHSIFQAQERERKLISRELHDGVGQSLFAMLLQVELLKGKAKSDEMCEQITKLQTMLSQTIEDVRHLSAELRPSTLDDFGLIVTLKNFIRDFSKRFGTQINFTIKNIDERLPYTMETALYRIAQEALINAIKYASADRIDVRLLFDIETSSVHLSVVDFGKGFELNPENRKGVGIYSMEERASMLDGRFEITSTIGEGTRVLVQIPFGGGVSFE